MFRLASLLTISVLLASDALAGPTMWNSLDSDNAAWFYNRPGVTLDALGADTSACQRYADAAVSGAAEDGFAHHGVAGAIIVGLNSGAPTAWHLDNCMIARGYRRFTASDGNLLAFATRFESMSDEQRLALVSAETPLEGSLTRQWENAYWRGASGWNTERRVEMRAGAVSESPYRLEPVDAASPITLGPDQVLLMFSMQFGPGERDLLRWGAVQFTHDNRQTGMPERTAVGRNGALRWPAVSAELRARGIPADNSPVLFVFVAPAGFYTLSSLQAFGEAPLNACMGTLAFDASPGSVLYLGNFSFEQDADRSAGMADIQRYNLEIEFDAIEAVRSSVGVLGARLQRAPYVNRFVRPCSWPNQGARPVYGLDIPGAPDFDVTAIPATSP